jgi:hypothetical protein
MKKFNELKRSLVCMTFVLLFFLGLTVIPGMAQKEIKKIKNSPVEVVEVVDDEEKSLIEFLDVVKINPVNIYMIFPL